MVSTKYTKSITADTLNELLSEDSLTAEILGSAIVSTLQYMTRVGDAFDVWFDPVLSGGDETIFDGLVAAHTGVPPVLTEFCASSKLVADEKSITSDSTWDDLGGVRTKIGTFMEDMSTAVGKAIGDVKSSGSGTELRLVKDEGGSEVVISAAYSVGDTSNVWTAFEFLNTVDPDAVSQIYKLQGRLNGATSASVRFASLSLAKIL